MKSFLFVLILPLILVACSHSAPEELLRKRLASLEEAIQDKNNSQVRSHFSENFSGGNEDGTRIEYKDLQRTLAGYFLRYKNIAVIITGVVVEMEDHDPYRATMHFSAVVTGAEGLIPDSAQVYSVELGWGLEDGEWLILFLRWEK